MDGRIEDLHGNVLVEARYVKSFYLVYFGRNLSSILWNSGIFVEPKLAAQLYHVGIPAVYPTLRHSVEKMAGAHENPRQSGNVNDAEIGVETQVKTR